MSGYIPHNTFHKAFVWHSLAEAIATDKNVQCRAHKGLSQGAKPASTGGAHANGRSPPYLISILKDPHSAFHSVQEPPSPWLLKRLASSRFLTHSACAPSAPATAAFVIWMCHLCAHHWSFAFSLKRSLPLSCPHSLCLVNCHSSFRSQFNHHSLRGDFLDPPQYLPTSGRFPCYVPSKNHILFLSTSEHNLF